MRHPAPRGLFTAGNLILQPCFLEAHIRELFRRRLVLRIQFPFQLPLTGKRLRNLRLPGLHLCAQLFPRGLLLLRIQCDLLQAPPLCVASFLYFGNLPREVCLLGARLRLFDCQGAQCLLNLCVAALLFLHLLRQGGHLRLCLPVGRLLRLRARRRLLDLPVARQQPEVALLHAPARHDAARVDEVALPCDNAEALPRAPRQGDCRIHIRHNHRPREQVFHCRADLVRAGDDRIRPLHIRQEQRFLLPRQPPHAQRGKRHEAHTPHPPGAQEIDRLLRLRVPAHDDILQRPAERRLHRLFIFLRDLQKLRQGAEQAGKVCRRLLLRPHQIAYALRVPLVFLFQFFQKCLA